MQKKRTTQGKTGRATGDFSDAVTLGIQVLFNLAARILRSTEEAENTITEVCLSTWRETSGRVDTGSDLTDTLISRTRNLAIGRRQSRTAGRDYRPVDLEALAKNMTAKLRDGKNVGTTTAAIAPALCGAIARCGTVTASALSHVFFGGLSIPETAEVLSISDAECRSRLQGGLDMIASRCGTERPAGHGREFSLPAAAHALGALEPDECPEFLEHLTDGCPDCVAELDRFSIAAGKLSYLLPNVQLPHEMTDKILFSLQLARVVSEAQEQPGADGDPGEPLASGPDPEAVPVPEAAPSDEMPRHPRSGVRVHTLLSAAASIVVGALVFQAFSLRETIGRQSELIESVQSKNAELLLQNDRLAGVSRFFESEGMVAILEGDGEYTGLTGKIVWDTAGKTAMLQILNFPPDLKGSELEVSAVLDGRRMRVAGLLPAGGTTGSVLYRFFPVESAGFTVPSGFTVAAVDNNKPGGRVTRNIMSGTVSDRRPGGVGTAGD